MPKSLLMPNMHKVGLHVHACLVTLNKPWQWSLHTLYKRDSVDCHYNSTFRAVSIPSNPNSWKFRTWPALERDTHGTSKPLLLRTVWHHCFQQDERVFWTWDALVLLHSGWKPAQNSLSMSLFKVFWSWQKPMFLKKEDNDPHSLYFFAHAVAPNAPDSPKPSFPTKF